MLRRLLPLCAALLVAVPSAGVLAPAHAADAALTGDESRLLSLINNERSSRGLVRVAAAAGTTDVARRWARHLSEVKTLEHNPNLGEELDKNGSPGWTEAGEDVGKAPIGDMDGLFRAYMNSPTHREVIIEPLFRYVGIGVINTASDGQAWNALDFVDRYGKATPAASRSPAPQQSREPAPAPASAPPAPRSPPQPRRAASAPAAPRASAPAAKPTPPATKPVGTTTATVRTRAGAASTVGAAPSAPATEALRLPPALLPPYDRTGAMARAVALLLLCAIGYLTAYEWSRRRLVTATV